MDYNYQIRGSACYIPASFLGVSGSYIGSETGYTD
jgi:hypothetical protein